MQFGKGSQTRVFGLNRLRSSAIVESSIRVPVPSTASTVSHQYVVTWAFCVSIPDHQSPVFVNWTEVRATHWLPENTSWAVSSALNVAFRMSKSGTGFGLMSETSWRLVTPGNVLSQRRVRDAVSTWRRLPWNVSERNVAPEVAPVATTSPMIVERVRLRVPLLWRGPLP